MDEQQAIARLKQGDLGGLEALVRRYQVQAVHAAYLIVHDRAQAEDVVQAAFLRSAEKIGQFDARRPFGPWFLRSVVNAAIKAANRQVRSISLDAEAEKETFSPAGWLADPQPGPEAQAERNETLRNVWQALEKLSPEYRAAIVLRYFLDLSDSEMVEKLGRPLTTIKWRLHTARERLRVLLHPLRSNASAKPAPGPNPGQPAVESSEQEQVP
jgi:RNA polymerase sigma-70 factor (ECF subfamily)